MAASTPVCDFGWKVVGFSLPGVDGKAYSLADVAGPNGTLIIFMCNHCPYVRTAIDRIVRDAKELQALGIGVIAISANDPETHPEDGFDKMREFADRNGFSFPYVFDESQDVARAYDAVCTPDFFGFNKDFELQYRGRIDAAGRNPAPPGTRRELFEAMRQVAESGKGPQQQTASIGCSIKWRRAA